ncbi:hypothetical protein EZV62_028037 [Acer yangbiense]|uniref:DUF659 domain-containing protein n=1 Tax=Acer yangbiense TaxID=1000413 RepID=A0A5C7GPF1_9ROSI|nr:hypothetical protein EZV62_028037 [Acer yangbiense]
MVVGAVTVALALALARRSSNLILSYQVDGKAEQNIELLVHHLADWLEEEHGKNLIFHTFSNTCWLTYGAILEKFQKQDPSIMRRIRGCIVDSAPVAAPDPQVWASGFSAAFLKKNRVVAREVINSNEEDTNALVDSKAVLQLGSPNLQLPNYVIPLMIQIILGSKEVSTYQNNDKCGVFICN